MRHMTNEYGNTIKVIEHIMLTNLWEYYMIEAPDANGIAFALVVGHEIEMGSVSIHEIEPYIMSRSTDLDDLMPAPQWQWLHVYPKDTGVVSA